MKLMQTDEIRINDSHYMRKLSRQIERSYEVSHKLARLIKLQNMSNVRKLKNGFFLYRLVQNSILGKNQSILGKNP
jgi:hypothetical protein